MREKKGFLLQTVQQMNAGAIVSGLGFLLYLALSALGQETAADIAAVALGMVSIYISYPISWTVTFLAQLTCYCLGMRRLKRRMGETENTPDAA